MSAKIEKTLGTIFGQTAVRRKETPDKDSSPNNQNHDKEKKEQQQAEEQRPADRESVEKAMSDLRSQNHFSGTGMKVEVINSKEGLRVRLAHASGATVKVMTAEEFLKLRESSDGEPATRGKILDQKF